MIKASELQAFENMLLSPVAYIKLKVGPSTIRTWKTRLKANKMSLDKMEELLLKFGAKKIPEKWEL